MTSKIAGLVLHIILVLKIFVEKGTNKVALLIYNKIVLFCYGESIENIHVEIFIVKSKMKNVKNRVVLVQNIREATC